MSDNDNTAARRAQLRTLVVLVTLSVVCSGGRSVAQETAPEKPPAAAPAIPTSATDASAVILQPATPEQIAALIEQLGHDDFFQRESAQEALAKVGFDAFDALSLATDNLDIEIAERARYLVRQMQVQWTSANDPPEVKALMGEYEGQNEQARLATLRQLARLKDGSGLSALCRIARFEQSAVTSKTAALRVIEQRPAETVASYDDASWTRRAATIELAIGNSARPAADWLRAYLSAHGAQDVAALPWERLAKAEEQTLKTSPQETRPELAIGLWRQQVAELKRLNRREEVVAAIMHLVALEPGEPATLVQLMEWLVEQQAWSGLDEVATRFADRLEQEPSLLYVLAWARQQQGQKEAAEATAEKAFKLNPQSPTDHYEVANLLRQRGLMDWAEREFRHIIELGPKDQLFAILSEMLLAEILHDRGNPGDELAAARFLEAALAALKENAPARDTLLNLNRDTTSIAVRMNFLFSCHYAEQNDRVNQVKHLQKALSDDPTDADVLIALYRVPDLDPQIMKDTRQLIKSTTDEYRREIMRDPREALNYNQLAWLVANTEGDQEEALKYSLQSLELEPGKAGYMDTLARCYYANKDYANAVKLQREAVALEPSSGLMRKQLKLFEETLANSPAKETPAPPAGE